MRCYSALPERIPPAAVRQFRLCLGHTAPGRGIKPAIYIDINMHIYIYTLCQSQYLFVAEANFVDRFILIRINSQIFLCILPALILAQARDRLSVCL